MGCGMATAESGRDPYYRDFATAYDEYSRGVAGDVEFYVDLARAAGKLRDWFGSGDAPASAATPPPTAVVTGMRPEPRTVDSTR